MSLTIAQAIKKLLIQEPFYGLFILSLNKSFDNSIGTACVCRNGINTELLINQEFWNSLSNIEEISVLSHEILHIILNHLTTNWSEFPNKKHLNIAQDCEVNSYLENLPEGAVIADNFGLPRFMGTKFYYENIPETEDDKYTTLDEHNWKDFEELSDAEKTLIENQIKHVAKNAAEQVQKMQGHLPGHLSEYIKNLFKERPAIFNWRGYFRRVVGNSIKTYIKNTRYKPSFRFKGQPGNILKFKPKILVAVDTSGSVSNKELSDFFTEVNHIYKSGVEVDVIEFDTDIQNKFVFKGIKQDIKISGRGGTNAECAFVYYLEHREYSSMIVFTDGYLSIRLPKAQNVIWVICSNGKNQDYPGKTIYIPKDFD